MSVSSKALFQFRGRNIATDEAMTWSANLVIISWVLKKFIIPRVFKKKKSPRSNNAASDNKKGASVVYSGFREDLKYLTNICFPSWLCKEAVLCFVFATVLLSRSLLSLVTAEVDGFLVKQLINRDRKAIITGVIYWLAIAVPSSLVNSLIKYLQSTIALSLRRRINAHIEALYFSNDAYYKLSHHLVKLPGGDDDQNSVEGGSDKTRKSKKQIVQYPPNTEQAVTEGITQWSERFADVISSLGKPMFDVTLFLGVLMKTLGWRNETVATIAVWESGDLLRAVRPNFTNIVQEKNNLEARFRGQYTRVVSHSEEIAFYGGDTREKGILAQQFEKIVRFTTSTLWNQCVYGTFEEFLTKYVWTAIGIIQVAVPLLNGNASAGDNAKYFISVRRVMTRAADAAERLVQGVRDVGELAGFTKNLMNTIHVLKFLSDPKNSVDGTSNAVVESSENIVVENLPLCTPTGDVLIDSMSLQLSRKDRLLILGPNGCGKSTLFRVLCGLWNPQGGRLARPSERTDMLFLPQRPYIIQGTLVEQVVYPLTVEEAEEKRKLLHPQTDSLDALILNLLATVFMRQAADNYGLHTSQDWNSILSAGEKQRLGLTRVFFHKPKYAILDECNSTLDLSSEEAIFDKLSQLENTGLITISHRHTLFKYHSKFLTYDGCGGYSFHETSDSTAISEMDSRSSEKIQLVTLIMEVCKELGENWPGAPSSSLKHEDEIAECE